MRIITQDDLKFSIVVSPSDLEPEEILDDSEVFKEVQDRLDQEDNTAWLSVCATVSGAGFTGHEHVDGFIMPNRLTLVTMEMEIYSEVNSHKMLQKAANDLIEEMTKKGWHAQLASFTVPKKVDIDWR